MEHTISKKDKITIVALLLAEVLTVSVPVIILGKYLGFISMGSWTLSPPKRSLATSHPSPHVKHRGNTPLLQSQLR